MDTLLGTDLAKLVRIWRALIDQRLKPLALTQTQWVTLHNIQKSPDGKSQIQLAKMIGIEQSSLIRTLNQLEEKGLIIRTACLSDRRARRVMLMSNAWLIMSQVEKIIAATSRDVLIDISQQEVENMMALVARLEKSILELQQHCE